MTNTPENTPPTPESPAAARRAGTAAGGPPRQGAVHPPPPRLTAALAAAMLAVGVALGAAIGPAPSSSFGATNLARLIPTLAARAASAAAAAPAAPSAAPPPVSATPTPAPAPAPSAQQSTSAPTPASAAPAPSTPAASTPSASTKKTSKAPTLAPTTNVWLIELSGNSFAEALTQPSAAPYIDTQAVPAGTLESGYSALQGSALASEGALLPNSPPEVLQTIVQPACPEGPTGASCIAGTPGALTAADEFLKATLPTITASAAYRAHGLIVITFASIVPASEKELPAGASVSTLTSEPPAGVLLISPFAKAGARGTSTFNPTSPATSLEKLLHQ